MGPNFISAITPTHTRIITFPRPTPGIASKLLPQIIIFAQNRRPTPGIASGKVPNPPQELPRRPPKSASYIGQRVHNESQTTTKRPPKSPETIVIEFMLPNRSRFWKVGYRALSLCLSLFSAARALEYTVKNCPKTRISVVFRAQKSLISALWWSKLAQN